MATTVTIDLRHVARGLGIPLRQVQAVVELLDDGNTVPFITRYRKDQTGGLDEEQIRLVQARLAKMRQLAERKQTILRSIDAQGKLTEQLTKLILGAGTTKRLEDLYLPFKPRKQTLATQARERGLEPLAKEILEASDACADLDARAADYANPDRKVPTAADALLGAGHILAEQFSERADLRQRLREVLQRSGKVVTSRIGGEAKPPAEPAAPAPPTAAPQDTPSAESESAKTPAEPAAPEPPPAPPAVESTDPVASPPDQAATGDPAKQSPSASPGGDADTMADETSPVAEPAEQSAEARAEPESATEDAAESNPSPPAASQPQRESSESPEPPHNPDNPAKQAAEAGDAPAPGESPSSEPATGAEAGSESPGEQPAGAEEPPQEKAAETPAPSEPGPPPAPPKAPKPPLKTAVAKKAAKLSKKELKKKRAEEKKTKAYQDYFDFSEELRKIPPHRVLAINRGERSKVLRVKIDVDLDGMHKVLDEVLVPEEHPHADYLRGCARDALARLILPALERECRRELTDRAENHAVDVFAKNLRNLLLQPPVRGRRTLAVDPGFKSGCKLVALDQFGNVLEHGVIYLIGRQERRQQSRQKIVELVDRYQLSLVAIGNGTACREAEDLFADMIGNELKDKDVAYVIVNEAGASVYSASQLGREEFPRYDASVRGAISIGRRLQDPLSELVKIDAANIGVGLYQHDVKAKHLRESLDGVVESCVNYVGVNVNSASPALLRYVSGLNQLTARRVYEYRCQNGPFRNREQLRAVPGFGEATFVQAAGFLKINVGDNPLDATWIHPESYETATQVLAKLDHSAADLSDQQKTAALAEQVASIDTEAMAKELGIGTLLLKDILTQFARPGRDPREDLPPPIFKHGVLKLEDLEKGMELTGTVLNVVDFGCFVDIGMHDSGLVHVSQLADKFIRDPHEVVAVGDIVKVWVIEVDKERRRVSLTMIKPGSEKPKRPRHRDKGGKSDQPEGQGEKRRERRGGGEARSGKPEGGPGQRRPRSRGEARGKGPRKHQRGPKPEYRPKPRPKPIIPITDEMKDGKEPMRTFGDLMQFFQHKQGDPPGAKKDPQSKKPPAKKHKRAPKDESDKAADAASATAEPATPDAPDPPKPTDAAPPETTPEASPQPKPETPPESKPDTPPSEPVTPPPSIDETPLAPTETEPTSSESAATPEPPEEKPQDGDATNS